MAWVFPEIPAQLLVFQILSKRIIIAPRWDKSPKSRKTFIAFSRSKTKEFLLILVNTSFKIGSLVGVG